MKVQSLIRPPTLTRELANELPELGYFLSTYPVEDRGLLVKAEIEEFQQASTKLKLHSFYALYNDFEGLLLERNGEKALEDFRKQFRMNFPYLAALDQMMVFFMPADRQPCAISCFFLSEVLARIIDVYGRSPRLIERFQTVHTHFQNCKLPGNSPEGASAQAAIRNMPLELFDILTPSLGVTPVLSLYQRTFDKLQSQYSNLPTLAFLQKALEKIFDHH